jgi:signal transduction histidine kinase
MHEIGLLTSVVALVIAVLFGTNAFRRRSASDAMFTVFVIAVSIFCLNLYIWLNLPPDTYLQETLRGFGYVFSFPMMFAGLQLIQTGIEARKKGLSRWIKLGSYVVILILTLIITILFFLIEQEIARRITVLLATPILGTLIAYYMYLTRNNPFRIPKLEYERGILLVNIGYLILIFATSILAGVLRLNDLGIGAILVSVLVVSAGGAVMGTTTFTDFVTKLKLGFFIVDSHGNIEDARIISNLDRIQNQKIAETIVPYINTPLERVLASGEELTIPHTTLESFNPSKVYQITIIPHKLGTDGNPLSVLVGLDDITDAVQMMETEQISDLLTRLLRESELAEFYLDLLIHDIGNIMQGIVLGVDMAMQNPTNRSIVDGALSIINEEVFRSTTLLHEIRINALMHKTDPELETIDILDLIKQSINIIYAKYPERNIRCTLSTQVKNLDIQAENILGYGFQLIFQYLVERSQQDIVEIEIKIHPQDTKNNETRIEISDNGPALRDSERAQLFFWRTREPSKGISMPLVRGILHRYNGSIQLESSNGVGKSQGIQFVLVFAHK